MEKVNFSIVKEKIIKTHVVLSTFYDLKNNYDKTLQNAERLKSESFMLKEALKNSTLKLKKANTKLDSVQLECGQLEEKILANDTNKLKTEISNLKSQIALCDCSNTFTKIKSLEKSCTSLELQVKELNEKNKKLIEANKMIEEKNDKTTEKIVCLKNKLGEFKSMSKKQQELESTIELIKQNNLHEVASLKNEIERLTVLESRFKMLQFEYDLVNSELSAIRHQKVIQTCDSFTETDDFLEPCFELDSNWPLEDQVENVEDIFRDMIFKEPLLSPLREDSDIDVSANSSRPEESKMPEAIDPAPISNNRPSKSCRSNNQVAKKRIRRKHWFPLSTGSFVNPKQIRPVKRKKPEAKPPTGTNDSILDLLKTLQKNNINCVISNMQETSSSASYYSTLETCHANCIRTKNFMLLRNVLGDTEPQLVGFTISPIDHHDSTESTLNRLSNRLLESLEKLAETRRHRRRRVHQRGASRLRFNSETESELEPIFNRLAAQSIAGSEDMADSGLVSGTSDTLSLDSQLSSGAVTPTISNVERDISQLAKRPVLISPLTSSIGNSPNQLIATQKVNACNNINRKITSDWVEQVNNQRKTTNTIDMDSTAFSICTADLNCSLGNFDMGIFNQCNLEKTFSSEDEKDRLQIQSLTDKQDEEGVEIVKSLRNRTITTPKVKRLKKTRKRPTTKRFVDDSSETEEENNSTKRRSFGSIKNSSKSREKKAEESPKELTMCQKKQVLKRAKKLSSTDVKERDKQGLTLAAAEGVQEDQANVERGLSLRPRTRAVGRKLCNLVSLKSCQGDKNLIEKPSRENNQSTARRSAKRYRSELEEHINSKATITQKEIGQNKVNKQEIEEFINESSLQNDDKKNSKKQRRDSFECSSTSDQLTLATQRDQTNRFSLSPEISQQLFNNYENVSKNLKPSQSVVKTLFPIIDSEDRNKTFSEKDNADSKERSWQNSEEHMKESGTDHLLRENSCCKTINSDDQIKEEIFILSSDSDDENKLASATENVVIGVCSKQNREESMMEKYVGFLPHNSCMQNNKIESIKHQKSNFEFNNASELRTNSKDDENIQSEARININLEECCKKCEEDSTNTNVLQESCLQSVTEKENKKHDGEELLKISGTNYLFEESFSRNTEMGATELDRRNSLRCPKVIPSEVILFKLGTENAVPELFPNIGKQVRTTQNNETGRFNQSPTVSQKLFKDYIRLYKYRKYEEKGRWSLEHKHVSKGKLVKTADPSINIETPFVLSSNCDSPYGSNNLIGLPKKNENIVIKQNIRIVPGNAPVFFSQLTNKSGSSHKNSVMALPSPTINQSNIEKEASSSEVVEVEPLDDLSPQSPPPVELSDRSPQLIPTEPVRPLPLSKLVALRTKLMIFANNDEAVEEVVDALAFQEVDLVLQIVFSQLESDVYDKPTIADAASLTPPLTKIQSILLGFMRKLERRSHPQIMDAFLNHAEKRLLQKPNCQLEIVHPIARLYTAVCKMRRDVERVRKFICENFYFKGDRAAPVLFNVLMVWPEVMPTAEESVDKYPLGAIIAQLTYLVTTNEPGYNIMALRDLLDKFYGYQRDARNCDEVFEQALIEYIRNPSLKLSELGLLIYLKNMPARWTYQKLEDSFMPLYARIPDVNSNLKATVLLSILKICLGFDKLDKFEVEALNKVRTWLASLSEVEGDSVVKETLLLGKNRLTKLMLLKKNAIRRQTKSQAKLQMKKNVQISNKAPSGLKSDHVSIGKIVVDQLGT